MDAKVFGPTNHEAIRKMDVIEAVLEGDLLSSTQEGILKEILDDYRPLIELGAMKKVTAHDCIEAFRILKREIPRMTGEHRRLAIVLMHKVQARDYENAIYRADEDPEDPDLARQMEIPVDPEEIGDALDGAGS